MESSEIKINQFESNGDSKAKESKENRPQLVKGTDEGQTETYDMVRTDDIVKEYERKRNTIMDQPLSEIIDDTLFFFAHSFDNYSKRYNEAEMIHSDYDETKRGFMKSLKIHAYALMLFATHEENIVYLGIWMIFMSIIIYFVNITTS